MGAGLSRDKQGIGAHTDTHTETDAGKDNSQRPKLASGKNECKNVKTDRLISPYLP